MGAFVIFVVIKSPHSADDNDRADPVVPKLANVVEAQVGARISAAETGMVVNDDFRQTDDFALRRKLFLANGRGVIAERAELPFRVDHAAVFF